VIFSIIESIIFIYIFHNCDYLQVLQLVFVGMEFATLFLTIAILSQICDFISYIFIDLITCFAVRDRIIYIFNFFLTLSHTRSVLIIPSPNKSITKAHVGTKAAN